MIDLDKIHSGMAVMTSDGQRLGSVKELIGHIMVLEATGPAGEDGRFSVPLAWVVDVADAVHLAKSREQAERDWRASS